MAVYISSLRVPIIVYTTITSQIGLSLPKPDRDIWESVSIQQRGASAKDKGSSSWGRVGLLTGKLFVWTCATYELAFVYVRDAPHHSPLSTATLAWLPGLETIHDRLYFDSEEIRGSNALQILGVVLLTIGAAIHLSSRYSLGKFTYFPIIPHSPQRMLYIPKSQIPAMNPPRSNPSSTVGAPADLKESKQEWSLRRSHRLVKSGVYNHIRHPMCSGTLITFIGTGLYLFAPGSFLRTITDNVPVSRTIARHTPDWALGYISGLEQSIPPSVTWTKVALGAFVFAALGTLINLVRLARREDEALSVRFEKEWTWYRWRVNYRFLPGVY